MSLKAGRELDALVAEKVMGWQWWRMVAAPDKRFLQPPERLPVTSGPSAMEPADGTETVIGQAYVAEFSTSIAAAWTVVEAFTSKGKHWLLGTADYDGQCYIANHDSECLMCEGWPDDADFISVAASTMPEAICLAALRAVGVEIPA